MRLLVGFLVIFSLLSPLLLIIGGIQRAIVPSQPVFIPESLAEGYEVLNQLDQAQNAIVLASYKTSNALPAYAYVRVVLGHGPESPNGKLVSEEVEKFYQSQTPERFRTDFLHRYQIQYVVWGDHERELGDWQPFLSPFLSVVYEGDTLVIFRVIQEKQED
ncbi:MAG: hypothetical protein Kow0088_06750 [Anaerolineales bacterium]